MVCVDGDMRFALFLFQPRALGCPLLLAFLTCVQCTNPLAVIGTLALVEPADFAAVRAAFEASGSALPDAVAGVVTGPLQSVAAAWATVSFSSLVQSDL